MNKTELVSAVAEKSHLTKKAADEVITHVFDTIAEGMASDGKVQVFGFGSFEVKQRAARMGRNPKTKETISIPASKAPVFKASKTLKDAIQNV